MTAVLSPTNPLASRDRMTDDDDDFSYSNSSIDWKARYNEVADMLAETRAELDDFHHTSKELEAELENELQRTEKAQQDLKVKVERAETEKDQWKSKFMSLQTTHNTTTASLQRELDQLRQEHQRLKVQLRELEMGNDDLERNERAVSSSLADVETKYSKALEEKILLEHELLDKANIEEQCQRLKDELADANIEISVLRDQLAAQQSAISEQQESLTLSEPSPSSEDLMATEPPPDLDLSDLTPSSESDSPVLTTPRPVSKTHTNQLRSGISKPVFTPPPPTSSVLGRSSTLPTLSPALRQPRTPVSRPVASRIASNLINNAVPAKNKGVQMVSEMRARVKNLEQKIHTRVPRLRMTSITNKASNTTSTREKTVLERNPFAPPPGSPKKHLGDTSGWVLIMEDSPSPPRHREFERRRVTSPTRHWNSSSDDSPTLTNLKLSTMHEGGPRGGNRPQSRLSGGSMSTTTTSSMSRPTTPTMLPTPTPIASRFSTTDHMGLKRSTTGPFTGPKRSSFGISSDMPPPSNTSRTRQTVSTPPTRPPSSTSSLHSQAESDTMLPRLPPLHSNITLRSSSARIPQSKTSSILSRSRIGKPQSRALSGRRSVGEQNNDGVFLGTPHPSHKAKSEGRPRSGSAADAHF